jgi:hypothetical protein
MVQKPEISVAFGGYGEGALRRLLWTGVVDDGGMGVLAWFHFLEIRGLVRLLFRPVTVSIGRAAQKNQRMHDFDRSNHDVVTTQE